MMQSPGSRYPPSHPPPPSPRLATRLSLQDCEFSRMHAGAGALNTVAPPKTSTRDKQPAARRNTKKAKARKTKS
jgi:hypothetical protein